MRYLAILIIFTTGCSPLIIETLDTDIWDAGKTEVDSEETQCETDFSDGDFEETQPDGNFLPDSDNEVNPEIDGDIESDSNFDELDADEESEPEADIEPCNSEEELCNGVCTNIQSNITNCGTCGRSCLGRFPSCIESECIAWSSCYEGLGPSMASTLPCEDVCENLGAPSTSFECVMAIHYPIPENPARWRYYNTIPGMEACADPLHNPVGPIPPDRIIAIVWSCCCNWE